MNPLPTKIPSKVRQASRSHAAGTWVRYSYVVRGTLYLLLGLYGLAAAIGLQGNVKTTSDIVRILGQLPFGNFVLIFVLIGLVGYGLWGLIRAIFNPLKKGSDISGLLTRFGYLASGISYLALSVLPINLLLNFSAGNASNSKSSAQMLIQFPGGLWVVGLIGLLITGGGIGQIYYGYHENFKKSLKKDTPKRERRFLLIIGKYGYIIRGIVFTLIGFFFLQAGLSGNSAMAKDPGEILLWTWQQSGGPLFLGIISAGLTALGIYSIVASGDIKLKSNA